MREFLSAPIVANDIRMRRTSFEGSFLIVEGESDSKFLRRFVDATRCQVVIAHSKGNAVGALRILEADALPGVLGIVDADFEWLEGTARAGGNLFLTDDHDIETMMVRSNALEKVLSEFGSEAKIAAFVASRGQGVREALIQEAAAIGTLRWVSQRDDLSLKFEGLPFASFLNKQTLTVNQAALIKAIKDRTNAPNIRSLDLAAKGDALLASSPDPWHVCCGHDVVTILALGLGKALGSRKHTEVTVETIERSLRLAYE